MRRNCRALNLIYKQNHITVLFQLVHGVPDEERLRTGVNFDVVGGCLDPVNLFGFKEQNAAFRFDQEPINGIGCLGQRFRRRGAVGRRVHKARLDAADAAS